MPGSKKMSQKQRNAKYARNGKIGPGVHTVDGLDGNRIVTKKSTDAEIIALKVKLNEFIARYAGKPSLFVKEMKVCVFGVECDNVQKMSAMWIRHFTQGKGKFNTIEGKLGTWHVGDLGGVWHEWGIYRSQKVRVCMNKDWSGIKFVLKDDMSGKGAAAFSAKNDGSINIHVGRDDAGDEVYTWFIPNDIVQGCPDAGWEKVMEQFNDEFNQHSCAFIRSVMASHRAMKDFIDAWMECKIELVDPKDAAKVIAANPHSARICCDDVGCKDGVYYKK